MTNTKKGLIITSLGALIMSFESLFIKLTTIEPLVFSFYIGIFMFLSTAIILIIKKKNITNEIYEKSFKYALLGAFLMAVSNLFFIAAIKNTLVANVVLILATAPLFSTLFAFLIYKVKPQKSIYIASFFIFIGLFIIFNNQLGFGNFLGNIYALICAILFSLSFVFLSRHTRFDRVLLICISGIILTILAFFLAGNVSIDTKNLLVVAAMGILITPISRVLIGNGTKFISASEVSLLMIIETIMAPIWVWLFLNEIPSFNTFIGGIIILLTLIANSFYNLRKESIK